MSLFTRERDKASRRSPQTLDASALLRAHLSLSLRLTSLKNPRRARAGGGATRSRGVRELSLEKSAGGGASREALGRRAGGEENSSER